jgi:hypothetical protein
MQQAGLGLYTSGVSEATWKAVWHIANVRCTNALQFWMNLCLYLLFNLHIYIYIYVMYFYIHTCGGQSKGGLASARGQWFLKGFKIMIKTKTSCSDFQMPFSSKSCEFGRFSSCLKWQNWLLLDISLLPILHSDKFVLPIIQMSNDPPIYLRVKECILRAYSASVCTWNSCYQPCPSDSLGGRMWP